MSATAILPLMGRLPPTHRRTSRRKHRTTFGRATIHCGGPADTPTVPQSGIPRD